MVKNRASYCPKAFAGKARNQEARRKNLIKELRSFESSIRWAANKAAKARAYLESCDAEKLANGSRGSLSTLEWIADIVHTEYTPHLQRVFAQLWDISDHEIRERIKRIGGNYESTLHDVLKEHIWPHIFASQSAKSSASIETLPKSATPELSPERALAEANKIITLLQNDGIEIDWSRDALNEREASLRAAIIRRAEIETTRRKIFSGANWVATALLVLAGCSQNRMGRDIRAAFDKWERIAHDECQTASRKNTQRLLDLARRDVDEGFQEDANSESDDYGDEDDNDDEYES